MTFINRKQMTPGLKDCKEMMGGNKAKEVKKETIKDVPTQIHKLKK
jgi:hypothetical protein